MKLQEALDHMESGGKARHEDFYFGRPIRLNSDRKLEQWCDDECSRGWYPINTSGIPLDGWEKVAEVRIQKRVCPSIGGHVALIRFVDAFDKHRDNPTPDTWDEVHTARAAFELVD